MSGPGESDLVWHEEPVADDQWEWDETRDDYYLDYLEDDEEPEYDDY